MKTIGRNYFLGLSLAVALLVGAIGWHHSVMASGQSQTIQEDEPDPADQNMAPVDQTDPQQAYSQQQQPYSQQQPAYSQQPGGMNQSQQPQYGQNGAPIERRDPSAGGYPQGYPQGDPNSQGGYPQGDPNAQGYPQGDQGYNDDPSQYPNGDPVMESDQAPPPLPAYDQPEAPEPNYLWTPGYWAWAPGGYYWVPGVWCAAPYVGALWTPPYWGFYGNRYRFYHGYWGRYVGFYGGINYGFGYFGIGYRGGYWNGSHFFYNRSVNHINVTRISNVYNHREVFNNVNRVSFNGGRGGLQARPRPAELAAMRQPRIAPMSTQLQVQRQAATNREQFFNQNRGRPAIVSAPRPIIADRVQRPSGFNQTRPGQTGQPGQTNRPGGFQPGQTNRPGGFQPGQQSRPGGQRFDQGQAQPGQTSQPGARPLQGNSQIRQFPGQQGRPQGEARPQLQPEARPQSQPQQQPRQFQQQQPRPQQIQPQQQPRPQIQPQQQPRPQMQPQQQPRPQMQQSRPQMQARPAPQGHAEGGGGRGR